MDDVIFQWVSLLLLSITLFLAIIIVMQKVTSDETNTFQFLIEQCLTESKAELFYNNGRFIISAGGNDTCWIQQVST